MIPYQKEKIDNAICFFAKEHYKQTHKPLYQTFLYKYLAFLDFTSLKETGRSVLGLEYIALPHGPVPMTIYNQIDKLNSPLFKSLKCENTIAIISKEEPDLDYFSKYEIKLMRKLIEIFADQYVSTNMICDASHDEIAAWKKTWLNKPNTKINPALTFDEEFNQKHHDKLTFPEECFLTYNAIVGRGK